MTLARDEHLDDDYPTCRETYATLRVFSATLTPQAVSEALGLEPTESFRQGDVFGKDLKRRETGWLLSSRDHVDSRDSRRHLAWILSQIGSAGQSIRDLKAKGAEIDICCYYVSDGQGGPTMDAAQLLELGQLGVSLWWDLYFASADNDA